MKIAVVFLLLTSGLCSSSFAQVIAKVGSKEITLPDFKQRYDEIKKQTVNPPTAQDFLDDLIRFEIGVQEAEKRNMQSDPAVRERIRQEMYKGLIEKELGKRVESIDVNEAEMKDYYKSNPELRSSHILIQYPTGASPEKIAAAKKRADEIYAEVAKSKRPFEELVKLYSDDTLSKAAGGDIGYQNRITMVPSYYEAMLRAKQGEITKPVQTVYGFHIIKVTGRRSFQDADRKQIRAAVFDNKRRALFDAFFKKLGSRYPVTKNENLIKSLE